MRYYALLLNLFIFSPSIFALTLEGFYQDGIVNWNNIIFNGDAISPSQWHIVDNLPPTGCWEQVSIINDIKVINLMSGIDSININVDEMKIITPEGYNDDCLNITSLPDPSTPFRFIKPVFKASMSGKPKNNGVYSGMAFIEYQYQYIVPDSGALSLHKASLPIFFKISNRDFYVSNVTLTGSGQIVPKYQNNRVSGFTRYNANVTGNFNSSLTISLWEHRSQYSMKSTNVTPRKEIPYYIKFGDIHLVNKQGRVVKRSIVQDINAQSIDLSFEVGFDVDESSVNADFYHDVFYLTFSPSI